MQKTQKIALTALFAALHAVLYVPAGPFRSFVVYLMPIEGVVLGPTIGFSSAFLGATVGRLIKPDSLLMFGIVAEPLGVLGAGLLARGRWKELVVIYGLLLLGYFLHPYGRSLPLWTILDLLVAFVLIYPVSRIGKWLWMSDVGKLSVALLLVAFVSTVADSMVRVFMLVPGGLYQFLGLNYELLADAWFIPGAVGSYIEDVLVSVATLIAGVPLLLSLRKILKLQAPLS